jgi:hypothetical protein
MGNTDTSRIQTYEQENTFISPDLSGLIREIDGRVTGAGCYCAITRTSGLISKIEYYADAGLTQKRIERTFSRTTGSDNVSYITGIITIFYNDTGTEDSRVSTVITRDPTTNYITSCANTFSTTEPAC